MRNSLETSPIGPRWLRRTKRAAARVRWVSKWRTVRRSGASPLAHAAHVLWSPELESFSYELTDPEDVVRQVAVAVDRPADELRAYLRELDDERDLTVDLRRRTRWRWTVRTAPAPGNRVAWYLLARALRPRLVVETGVYDGLGSLVLLCALRRNALEGDVGELVSIDPDPDAGTLVPAHLADGWRLIEGTADRVLGPALEGRRVGLFFSDSPHTRANQELEVALAERHAATELVIVEGSGGWCPVLGEFAERRGVVLHTLRFDARGHFYGPAANGLVRLAAGSSADRAGAARP